jgi:hypothetical protein
VRRCLAVNTPRVCICPRRRRLLQWKAVVAAIGEGGAAEGAGEGGAVSGSREVGGGKVVSLPLSLSPLFRWWLARVKRRVVVGPAEMGLLGLRFKAGLRR